ncbi:tRNA preQ1(34) S-adenosylmethionine ribosyltransferase-isomerase QueA [Hungatella sp. SB206]|uniref:tRNA preQ1(34) S-adenosylmethionine ribosyltransferase-isomerase QueA n=1 Tax=Hungatella sp. SB206 TaxID=2937758 RepID=UPI003DA7B94E
MRLDEFRYDLPANLIAQQPIKPRHCSRLMITRRNDKSISNYHFYDLPDFLDSGDVLVINNTRVIHAVLNGKKIGGGNIQIKMVSRKDLHTWDCIVETLREIKPNDEIIFGNNEMVGRVIKRNWCDTGWIIEFSSENISIDEVLDKYGKLFIPLHLPQSMTDEEDYQTVYAAEKGSLQPPTGGMHFTYKLFESLKQKGVKIVEITQHVGRLDNRLPIDNIESHEMYEEYYNVTPEAAEIINSSRKNGHKIIGVGTTVTRTLETVVDDNGIIHPGTGWTKTYIYPGFKFRAIDVLITNFQSPGITTLILACAFGGTELIMQAYNEAVIRKYHFLEYGDSLCII